MLQANAKVLADHTGEHVHLSPWIEITQRRIDAFADATGDSQWIHTDPDRAAAESPFGSTIAHGYLLLSLYPQLRGLVDESTPAYAGVSSVINYGINKCRFLAPVKAGDRVRGNTMLSDCKEAKGGVLVTETFTLEIDGQERPAFIAEVLIFLQGE